VGSTDTLVRVVAGPDGALRLGRGLAGRGAWLCAASISCAEQAARRKAYGRALRAPVTPEAVDRLLETLRTARRTGGPSRHLCEDGGSADRATGAPPDEEEGP